MSSDATTTLAMAIGVGGVVSALSARARIPAVLPLLVFGVALGPSLLGLVDASTLGGPSGALGALIAISIGLLVFEGGLHLDRRELGHAPRAVLLLLTLGTFVTWMGVTVAGVYLLGLEWPIALILGAVLIVTGPTVIQPIIRKVRLGKRLQSVLSAEAILNDPIGVLISVLTLEVVTAYYVAAPGVIDAGDATAVVNTAQEHLVRAIVTPIFGGLIVGVASAAVGWVVLRILARGRGVRTHSSTLNVAAMGVCMLAIAAGEFVAPEWGDSNPRNVELASRDSLAVVRADATDPDRVSELQREHDIGWVIAWTGNDDVDAIVSRWADRALGENRSRIGLPTPPTADKAGGSLSSSATMRHIEHAMQEDRLELAFVPPEYPGARLIRFKGVTPLPPPKAGESRVTDERWLVLRMKEAGSESKDRAASTNASTNVPTNVQASAPTSGPTNAPPSK